MHADHGGIVLDSVLMVSLSLGCARFDRWFQVLLTKAGFFCRFLLFRLRGDPRPLPDHGGLPLTVTGGGGGGGGGPGGQGGGGAVLQLPQTTPGLPGEGQAGPDPLRPEVISITY